MSRKNSDSSSELFEEKPRSWQPRRSSSMDLTPMRPPANKVKHSTSVDDIKTSSSDDLSTPEKDKSKKKSIRDYMVPKTPASTSSGDVAYDQVKTTRSEVSEALNKLVKEKSKNDEIDEMERKLWEDLRGKDKQALKFNDLDSDDAPSDIETEKFNFALPTHIERSIFQELTSKPIFKQSNMFTKFCTHSVFTEICELTGLSHQNHANRKLVQSMLVMGLLRCSSENSKLTQVLLKLYSVTAEDELLISLPELLTHNDGQSQSSLDVRTWQDIFSNYGFVDGLYEAETTERAYSCLYCEQDTVTQDLLFSKLSFIVEYFVENIDLLKPTLNDAVIGQFMRLFTRLLQTERYVTLICVLQRALKTLADLAYNWDGIKTTLVTEIISNAKDCKCLEIIVNCLPTNSPRCDELTKMTAFFAIHKVLGLPYGIDLLSDGMNIVNFESAASLTSYFTMQKLRSVKPFGVEVKVLDIIFSCVYLLQICIGNLPIMSIHKSAMMTILKSLSDLNISIRVNSVLETLEVKHIIKLVMITLQFQINFVDTALTSSNTIFKHLRKADVVEELVYDGNNTIYTIDSDSDDYMEAESSSTLPPTDEKPIISVKIEPEDHSLMYTEVATSSDRASKSPFSMLKDGRVKEENISFDPSSSSSGDDNIFEKMKKHMKDSQLEATTLNSTASLIPKDYFKPEES